MVRFQRLFGRLPTKSKPRKEYCIQQLKLEDVYGSDGNVAPFNWLDSRTRRRSDVVVVSKFAVLTMAQRKKQLVSELFCQGPFAHIQCIINTIAIENCVGINISKDNGMKPTKEKCIIKLGDAKNAQPDTEVGHKAIDSKQSFCHNSKDSKFSSHHQSDSEFTRNHTT